MKIRIILLSLFFFFATCAASFSQSPMQFNYQAVARDNRGVPLSDQDIRMRFSIHTDSENGAVEYMEIRKIKTNQFGMFSVGIGSEGAFFSTGTLRQVNWKSGLKYLQAEMDPKGGNSYVNLGSTQLVSVPYALFALSTADGSGGSFSGAAGNGLSIIDSTIGLGNKPGETQGMLTEDRELPLGGKTFSITDNRSSVSFNGALITIQQDSTLYDGENVNKGTFLKINPIQPRADAVPFLFNRTATIQHNGNTSPNEVVTWGHNIGGGGGAYVAGLPGIGYSLESNYKPTTDSRLVESHEFYITPAGRQVRLKSYTIYTDNDMVDFYHSTHNFYLKNPTTGVPYFMLSTELDNTNNKQLAMGSLQIDVNEPNKQIQFLSAQPNTELYIRSNFSKIYLPGLIIQDDGLQRLSGNMVPEADISSVLGRHTNRFASISSANYQGMQLALKTNWQKDELLNPTSTVDIEGIEGFNQFRLRKSYTPNSSSDPNGAVGDMAWDENYIYIKTESGWKRTNLTNF